MRPEMASLMTSARPDRTSRMLFSTGALQVPARRQGRPPQEFSWRVHPPSRHATPRRSAVIRGPKAASRYPWNSQFRAEGPFIKSCASAELTAFEAVWALAVDHADYSI